MRVAWFGSVSQRARNYGLQSWSIFVYFCGRGGRDMESIDGDFEGPDDGPGII